MSQDILKALEIMGYGVLAIFIVIAILIIVVYSMRAVEKKTEEDKLKPDYKPLGQKIKERFIIGGRVFVSLFKREKKDSSDNGDKTE